MQKTTPLTSCIRLDMQCTGVRVGANEANQLSVLRRAKPFRISSISDAPASVFINSFTSSRLKKPSGNFDTAFIHLKNFFRFVNGT